MSETPEPTPAGAPRQPIDPTGTSTPPPPPPGYVPAVYVQGPGSGRGTAKIVTYLLLVALLVSVTMNVYLFGPVKIIAQALAGGVQELPYDAPFEPTGDDERIVVVEVTGTIDGPTAAFARQAFQRLEEDKPGAVVLRVNSGGGGVTASDQIWHAIESFKAKHPDVPVVASFGGLAASGGYYIAAPADRIFIERTGITGSIGVLAQIPALGGMVEKVGVEMNMVIAKQSPEKDDANNLFAEWYNDQGELTEYGEDSMAVLENLLGDAYETFFTVVKEGRMASDKSITEAELKQAATGAIFVGEEAIQAKLADDIGYLDDAIEYAMKEAKLKERNVRVLREPSGGGLLSMASRDAAGVNLTDVTGEELRQLFDDASAVRLEYRMRIR